MSSVPNEGLGLSTVVGYPRIGPRRELKTALESYWDGRSDREALRGTARWLRADTWRRLADLGLGSVPSLTFSYYDQVLDTAQWLGAVPERYHAVTDPLDRYFAMARGTADLAPLRMTKWFDTNYHYIVPAIGPSTPFSLAASGLLEELREAKALGLTTRPVLLGPVTFLLLSQSTTRGFTPLDRLDDVVDVYAELLSLLASEGAAWVQLDEPALVADRSTSELAALKRAYDRLGAIAGRPKLLVSTYFGDPGEALPVLAASPAEAIGLDLVRGRSVLSHPDLDSLAGKTIVGGVVSGRDVWRTDADDAIAVLTRLRERVGTVVVGTSCSLLHVPYDLTAERDLTPELRSQLAFAEQKVSEVVTLAATLAETPGVVGVVEESPSAVPSPAVVSRNSYGVRAGAQANALNLPLLPTTTIGSFPQTSSLRSARASLTAGSTTPEEYDRLIEAEIERVIRLQERLGIDVLVHGEPERNDMVQYFAEHLDGFATTRYGWVQSYGSRCTRPPILYGDVKRPEPITVRWATYAQSLTERPVKGMLTGPVTIVAWSFVRRDVPLPVLLSQVADAIAEEVADLAAAGTSIIQVDEPALRELLPLRRSGQEEYLAHAVAAYRRATALASDEVQIHTHLCYSDADQVLSAIDGLDADVTTIESARSGGRILSEPDLASFARGLGPGVYDIHSPRVPSVGEVSELLSRVLSVLPAERVWVNPDCGLKTRAYEQVEAALANLVTAARSARSTRRQDL